MKNRILGMITNIIMYVGGLNYGLKLINIDLVYSLAITLLNSILLMNVLYTTVFIATLYSIYDRLK
jgi:uncharacterized membrane protein YuzA (DUF378 family)